MLGLVINAYKLTVGIPVTYMCKVLLLLKNTWHPGRKKHLLSHLYTSIAHALSKNKRLLLESSKEFQNIVWSLEKGNLPRNPQGQS
jgi:hypothetical protein